MIFRVFTDRISTPVGLAGYSSLKFHHNVTTMLQSRSFMDRHKSELHHSNWRQGEVIEKHGPRVFQIETTVNNNTFGYDGPLSTLQKREWEWTPKDRALFLTTSKSLRRTPARVARKIFHSIESPYRTTSVQAGSAPPAACPQSRRGTGCRPRLARTDR